MCVTAVLAAVAVVTSAVGTVSSIGAANANAANAAYQAKVANKQSQEARDTARVQALQSENARTSEFQRARSSALASIGAAGLGEQISFFQGIDPAAQAEYLRDVRNIRLNLVQTESSLADQIQVSDFGAVIARKNAGAQKIGAIANFAQTAMQAASFYQSNKAPAKAGGG